MALAKFCLFVDHIVTSYFGLPSCVVCLENLVSGLTLSVCRNCSARMLLHTDVKDVGYVIVGISHDRADSSSNACVSEL